jgi:hypothetical protein
VVGLLATLLSLTTINENTAANIDNFQDGHVYINLAFPIIEGGFGKIIELIYTSVPSIGLPLVYAVFFHYFGFTYTLVNTINFVLWLCTGYLTYRIALHSLRQNPALLITLIYLTFQLTFIMTHSGYPGNLYTVFSLGTILSTLVYSSSKNQKITVLIGITCLIGALLTRPVSYALVTAFIATGCVLYVMKVFKDKKFNKSTLIQVSWKICIILLVVVIGFWVILTFSQPLSWYVSHSIEKMKREEFLPHIIEVLQTFSYEIVHIQSSVIGVGLLLPVILAFFIRNHKKHLVQNFYILSYLAVIFIYASFSMRYIWPILPFILINIFALFTIILEKYESRKNFQIIPEILFSILLLVNMAFMVDKSLNYNKQHFAYDVLKSFKWIDDNSEPKAIVYFRSNAFVKAHKIEKKYNVKVIKSVCGESRHQTRILDEKSYIISQRQSIPIQKSHYYGLSNSFSYWDRYVNPCIENNPEYVKVMELGDAIIWQKDLSQLNLGKTNLVLGGNFKKPNLNLKEYDWQTINGPIKIENNKLKLGTSSEKCIGAEQLIQGLKAGHRYLLSTNLFIGNADVIVVEVGGEDSKQQYIDIGTMSTPDQGAVLKKSFIATGKFSTIRLIACKRVITEYASYVGHVSLYEVIL